MVAAILIGLYLAINYSLGILHVPASKKIAFKSDKHIDAIVTWSDTISIPVEKILEGNQITSEVIVKPLFRDYPKETITIKDIILSSNTTNSYLLIKNPSLVKGETFYTINIKAGHQFQVKNWTEPYFVSVFYRHSNDTAKANTGPVEELTIPITFRINQLDLGLLSYFWIIFSGVVISRVFQLGTIKTQFDVQDIIWIPSSAIITLLIFSGFVEQFKLTDNILANIALAFSFGIGFDKVFETWSRRRPAIQHRERG
jgi:hypothetical protein